LRRLKVDGLVSVASDGTITAIAPEEARAHLDRLWDRLLDVDTLDKAASSGTA
jgi:acylphosphatase